MQKQKIILSFFILVGIGAAFFAGSKWKEKQLKDKIHKEPEVYAVYDGGQVLSKEVLEKAQDELQILENNVYQVKKRTTEDIIWQRKQIQPEKKAEEALSDDQEFNRFLIQHGANPKKISEADKKKARTQFNFEKQRQIQIKNRQQTLAAAQIQWQIPLPGSEVLMSVEPGFLSPLGKASASHEVIVFANFHCAFCPEAFNKIKAVREQFKDSARIHFRFYDNEAESSLVFKTELAAACADEQKKFWEMAFEFSHQAPMKEEDLLASARTVNLDMGRFETCLKEQKYKKDILKDRADAVLLKKDRPPLLVVDGRVFYAQEPLEKITAVLSQNH